jgi:hypothetical protein
VCGSGGENGQSGDEMAHGCSGHCGGGHWHMRGIVGASEERPWWGGWLRDPASQGGPCLNAAVWVGCEAR